MPSTRRVIVVGAGIGGLSAAIALASQGAQVDVLEGAALPGGKLAPLQVGSARLDCGPTVFTMRWVFDELYALAGEHFDRHLSLQPARTLARHAWSSDERLDLQADIEASVDAIGDFAGVDEALRYRSFCARSARVYRALESTYLRAPRPAGPVDLARRFGLRGLPQLVGISPFGSLWHALGRELRDPRLQQLFGRYATYCGSSPFDSPATLMLVAHVEQQGVWLVEGGMHRLAASLADLAVTQGASLRYGAAVSEITVRDGRTTG
ncbi:MAG: FAD-binding protein, partial [Comamonadaceae bacterium]